MLVLIDESKAAGYILAVVRLAAEQVAASRSVARSWIRSGQHRVHAKSESNTRRHELLTAASRLNFSATLYVVGRHMHERAARQACLAAALRDLPHDLPIRVVLERDEQAVNSDKQVIIRVAREIKTSFALEYAHLRSAEEPLLAIPDLLAWCWQRGGSFRHIVSELVVIRHV